MQIFHWIFTCYLMLSCNEYVVYLIIHFGFWSLNLFLKVCFLSVGRGKKPWIENCSEGFFLALHFTICLCLNFVLQWFYTVRDGNWFVLALKACPLFLSLSFTWSFRWTKDTEKCKNLTFLAFYLCLCWQQPFAVISFNGHQNTEGYLKSVTMYQVMIF